MYTQFFGLRKKPFTLSCDPEFFYFSKNHDLAFTHLKNGLIHNVGFMALTGDAGTGKTTLLRYLINHIRSPVKMAMIFNTQIDPHSLLEMLAKEFEITPASYRKSDLYYALYQLFTEESSKRARCVIFVDEAQNLSLGGFEELRMLSNFEGNEPLVQIILVGQPQLRTQLAHPWLAQLTQRVSVHCHLSPLQFNDIRNYVDHRLYVAGSQRGATIFEREAVDLIAEASKGIPRVINSICDASLARGFADGLKTISSRIVEKVISDKELLLGGESGIEASWSEGSQNGKGPGQWPFATGLDSNPEIDASAISGLTEAIANLLVQISSLEKRLAEANAADSDRIIGPLQEMLAKEREKNSRLEAHLSELQSRYKDILRERRRTQESRSDVRVDGRHTGSSRTPWGILSRGKRWFWDRSARST